MTVPPASPRSERREECARSGRPPPSLSRTFSSATGVIGGITQGVRPRGGSFSAIVPPALPSTFPGSVSRSFPAPLDSSAVNGVRVREMNEPAFRWQWICVENAVSTCVRRRGDPASCFLSPSVCLHGARPREASGRSAVGGWCPSFLRVRVQPDRAPRLSPLLPAPPAPTLGSDWP